MADIEPGASARARPRQNTNLGPIPIALCTMAAVLSGAFLVDLLQDLLLSGLGADTRHVVTILFCAVVAGTLAGLAARHGAILMRRAAKQRDEREQLEAELRHILDSVRLFLWHATVVEENGQYIWDMRVSHEEAASRTLPIEVPPGRTFANSWFESKLPEDSLRSDESSLNAFKQGLPGYSNEYRCVLKSGDLRWFYEDVLIERTGPKTLYVMGASVDVTALKQVEAELEAERTLLQTVIDSLPDPVFVKDRESRFLLDNAAHMEHLGVSKQSDLAGKTDFDLFPREVAEPFYEDEQRLIHGEKEITRIEFSLDRNGNERWFWTTKVPLTDKDGEVIGVVGINRDITERQREQEELEQARDAALASTRAKSEFLANMSHEIRTPMNGILGITELMLGTHLTDEQYDLAKTVRSSAEALLTVINDILDFSRVEAGKMLIESSDFNLRTIVEEVTDLVAGNAFRKGLELACFFEKDVPERLKGDPARIRQILTNLMGNAVKFTEKGEVILEVRLVSKTETEATIRLAVIDTGIGVSEQAQSKIFESFTQADGTTTRKYGGTGLGLAICRQLTQLMGGRIGLESEPGRGSTFFVELPLPRQIGAPERSSPAPPELMTGLRVLVVDDNATNRRVLREQLTSWGCEPTEVPSAKQAIPELESAFEQGTPFRAAILDMQMPEIDGEQLARMIRKDSRFDPMPMILYTSIGDHGSAEEMRATGFAAVLTKPARQSQLYNAMLTVLGEKEALRPGSEQDAARDLQSPLGLSILLAEDNEINQMVAKMMLERFGCEVEAVETGRLAVQAISSGKRFDAVLMDVHMPEMDGYTATAEIRRYEQQTGEHTPIIAMTAKAMPGDRELCLAAGMDDYIVKPVRPDDLHSVLEKWSASAQTTGDQD